MTSNNSAYNLIKTSLVCMVIVVLVCTYAARRFSGLVNPEAMEYAQIARNLSQGKGFTTSLVRPVTHWYLARSGTNSGIVLQQPDVLHGPVYPAVLAAGFMLARPSFEAAPGNRLFAPETWVIVPVGILLTLATGLLILNLGSTLFSRRIGLVAMLIYLSCGTVLAGGISGGPLPLVTFLLTAAFYAIMVAVIRQRGGHSGRSWHLPLLLSAIFCGLAFLTRYATLAVVPVFILFLGFALRRRRVPALAMWLSVFLLLIAPWIVRNIKVSGEPCGLAPYTALSESHAFPADTFERDRNPDVDFSLLLRVADTKLRRNFGQLYDTDFRLLGSGFAVCFFFVSFLYRFVRDEAHFFRWSLLAGMVMMLAAASAFGQGVAQMMSVFMPMVALFGTAFLFLMITRLELNDPFADLALAVIAITLTAIPAVLSAVQPISAASFANSPRIIQYLCSRAPKTETICTDIPWATSWYAGHSSLLLPLTLDDMAMMDGVDVRIGGLHLTPETGKASYSDMVTLTQYRSWLPILNGWLPPTGFPLTEAIRFPPGRRDCIFLYRPLPELPASAFPNAASNARSG